MFFPKVPFSDSLLLQKSLQVLFLASFCQLMSLCMLSCVQLVVTPWTVDHQAPLWDFSGKNPGAGCHFLLQGIFPTPGSNPCLLHFLLWQEDSLPLAPPGERHSLYILPWCFVVLRTGVSAHPVCGAVCLSFGSGSRGGKHLRGTSLYRGQCHGQVAVGVGWTLGVAKWSWGTVLPHVSYLSSALCSGSRPTSTLLAGQATAGGVDPSNQYPDSGEWYHMNNK